MVQLPCWLPRSSSAIDTSHHTPCTNANQCTYVASESASNNLSFFMVQRKYHKDKFYLLDIASPYRRVFFRYCSTWTTSLHMPKTLCVTLTVSTPPSSFSI